MSAIEPAGEKIVRNLQQAVQRLQDDLARVELWAGALGCFSKPIPGYDYGQTKFDLPAANARSSRRKTDTAAHRKTVSKIGSPRVGRYLAWRVGNDLQAADPLRTQLHQPERLESVLKISLVSPASVKQ